MRMLRCVVVLSMLALLAAAPVEGGPGGGTAVYRGEGWNLWIVWNDYAVPGDTALIAVLSSDPAYLEATFCDGLPPAPGEGWLFLDYQFMGWQKLNAWVRGSWFTRVFRATIPAVLDDPFACSLVRGEAGPQVAEGISRFKQNPSNICEFGPGQYRDFWRSSGTLYDRTGQCPGGMVAYDWSVHYHWENVDPVTCIPTDPTIIKVVGPALKCAR